MPETLLVIEDDGMQADVIKILLGNVGYDVVVARDGLEGLRRMYETQPDLVLLDLMIPKMDGWEVCRRIREMSNIPIVITTSRRTADDTVKGLRLGADDYVVKPFNPHELIARIGAILRRRHLPSSRVTIKSFANGALYLDPTSLIVAVDKKQVELTPTEHRILTFLAHRAGQVVPVEDIFCEVWGYDTEVNVNSVKWYIWRLRQKIHDDNKEPRFIFTERGNGYRFISC
jgi:two-component system, OmpR family, response regulator VicR